jgi:hypothetical protein
MITQDDLRAWCAVSMPSLTKWKVVPPGRSQGSRFSCVTTKTGVWNGASSGLSKLSSLRRAPQERRARSLCYA